MELFRTIEKWFVKIIELCCMVIFAVMILLVGAQVVMRFIAQNASDMSWSEEAVRFLLCYMVFFGALLLYESQGHVWVTNLVDAVPAPIRKLMLFISYIVQAAFFIAILVGAMSYLPTVAMQKSNVLHLPLHYVYAVVPITAAFSLVFCIRDAVCLLLGKGDLNHG